MESLLDIILRLLGGDEQLKAEYEHNPDAFADKYFGNLCAQDWDDLKLVLDQSSVVQRDVDFSRSYDTGGNVAHASSVAPVVVAAGGGAEEHHHHYHHEDGDTAVTHLNNIVNTYSYVDDRDTITDQSTNQVINTGGGDFWQRIDNNATTASGDGAVAAGDDINGNVNTGHIDNSDHSTDDSVDVSGDGNIVGDGNVVGNSQDNSQDHSVVDVDLNVAGHDIDNSQDNDGVDIDKSFNDNSDHSAEDSFNDNSDHSTDNSVDDSFNGNDLSSDDDKVNIEHSGNAVGSFNEDNDGVDDDSTTTQHGLLNLNDTLSHNNVPIGIDVL